MAPKQTPAAKRLAVLAFFRNSGTAHTLKDLEKAIPSIASINGMQVKEYIQSLLDEDDIRVEKIGSGNWYWSFAGEEAEKRADELDRATKEWDKATVAVQECKDKIAAEKETRVADDAEADEKGVSMVDLMAKRDALKVEVAALAKEVASYADSDPAEQRARTERIAVIKAQTELSTERIDMMAGWIKSKIGVDRASWASMMKHWCGDEWDDEEGCLKEL